MISRRSFLELLGTAPLALKSGADDSLIQNTKHTPQDNPSTDSQLPLLIPPKLQKGDLVAFTAPASPVNSANISTYVNYFKEQGCRILIGNTIKNQSNNFGFFSAEDKFRADELNTMFADDNIKAIVCGRGGYGVMRILPDLNYELFRKNPKIVIGYSDITALHTALQSRSKVVTYHGPVAVSKLTPLHRNSLQNALFSSPFDIKYALPEMKVLAQNGNNTLSGKLQGGNLTLISTTMGTPYECDLENALFFFEDTSVNAHEVDRMLTQLLIAGKFDKCRGFLVGKIKNMDKRESFYPSHGFSILQCIEQIAQKANLTCVFNLPFGHVESQLILPYGLFATLVIKNKSLVVS
ncbi:MAG: LD-carboxypeptidase [Ignavibacteria bacterium]|jgi:muramoyltetrapeptide carboxypeptidase|nr:LD-carboxypeptidase [Ignavibacteria bacterium]